MSMLFLKGNEVLLKYYEHARYATNVIFHQPELPTDTIAEAKKYYSRKYHLCGYKTEVSVLPNGLAIGCSRSYAGSTAGVCIFRETTNWHKKTLVR